MEFRYAHLADYAGDGGRGKVTVVGIFDTIFVTSDQRPVTTPGMSLVASFECHVTEGTQHDLELRIANQDGVDIFPRVHLPLRFVPSGPDRPLLANAFIQLGPMPLPDVGEYAFHVFVDRHEVTSIPLHVIRLHQTPPG